MTFGDLLDRMRGLRAVVVGDLMLDEYIVGRATRISPEAPVMVVRRERSFHVPGGAANVAKNLMALGAEVRLVGVCGDDAAGLALRNALQDSGVDASGVVVDPDRPTTCKTRIMADHAHQVLRIDTEQDDPVSESAESALAQRAEEAMDGVDVVVLSDYRKGALTGPLVARIQSMAGARPVCVNPKPESLRQYRGVAMVTLNRSEASLAASQRINDLGAAKDAAQRLRKELGVDVVVVTMGEAGMVAATASDTHTIAAPKVEVYDTAGAGDTVIATLALGWAALGPDLRVFEMAALTASAVVRKVGVAVPSSDDLGEIRSLG